MKQLAGALVLSIFCNTVAAEPLKEKLVGTWLMVSATASDKSGKTRHPWGEKPIGTYIFTEDGHFAQIFVRPDLPKIKSRAAASPEEAKQIVRGSLAMFGTYAINEKDGVVTLRVAGSTLSSQIGTEGKRQIKELDQNQLQFSNPGTSEGLVSSSTWRRAN